MHARTFGVGDWRQVVRLELTGERVPPGRGVAAETESILRLLDRAGVRGTFFVLGNVAAARLPRGGVRRGRLVVVGAGGGRFGTVLDVLSPAQGGSRAA